MSNSRARLYRSDETRTMLREILNLGDAKIEPKISTSMEYLPKDSQINRLAFDEATALMDRLSEAAILRRRFYDKTIRCPHCQGFAVRSRFVCPRCGSHDLLKGDAIEHLRCGFVGLEESFKSGKDLFCPKCRRGLNQIGVDYKRAGTWFRCRGCDDFFGEPAFRFYCEDCRSLFRLSEAILKDVYIYEINEGVKAEIQENISYPDQIFSRLRKDRFDIDRRGEIGGRSGVLLSFDLLLEKNGKLIAIEFIHQEASLDKILTIYAKSMEIDLHRIIAVVMAGIRNDVRLLAETYGIVVIESDDPDVIVDRLETLLQNL